MLDIERSYMEANREKLLMEYGGKILVIKGKEVCGAYDTMDDALQAAATQFGLESVLIRRPSDAQIELSAPALTLGILNASSTCANDSGR
jgi:hypothetical protein